ncbi:twin-arginine translocase TatA/TatE family subunit [Eilatimonas milleporae]|uniref:Sec-independent protein translocase protein TatA n=1 Tax=Eilatimonas milleporae TaxID=911205 RepID=A0A3M0CEB0_9PROT|nr:twin-arginine translocase TatA/TatE family subunit [Eilatimonas milleporae]RMB08154.1 sec-independent protein translocase protein TatA [Eilatimonas milleporae]
MSIGPWQIALIGVLLILLFGRGKISGLMGDVGRGITAFKKGLKTADEETSVKLEEPAQDAKVKSAD